MNSELSNSSAMEKPHLQPGSAWQGEKAGRARTRPNAGMKRTRNDSVWSFQAVEAAKETKD